MKSSIGNTTINNTTTNTCNVAQRSLILPLDRTPSDLVTKYWRALSEADLIKYRLGNLYNPNLLDVYRMMEKCWNNIHFVADLATNMLVGEFSVSVVSGKMGTIHFSVHPQVSFASAVKWGGWCTDTILNEWRDSDTPDDPYITSLVGITPALNRQACLFVRRSGFKRVMELKDGCYHLGKLSTALMTIKYRTSTDN